MEVNVEVDKIIKCAIYNTVFFPSSGGVDDVLVRLLLIKQIIKDSVSNIHRYFENRE